MRVTIKTGILFAAVWMLIKLSFLGMGKANDMLVPAVMLNIFLLLSAISVGLYLEKRKETEESNALRDVKNGMVSGVIYAALVSIFIYFYYDKIDPDFNKHQIAEQEILLEKTIKNPVEYKKLKASNEAFETMTEKEIRRHFQKSLRANYSPKSVSTVGLLAMLLLSTLNSIFVTAVYRKVVFSKRALK